MSIEVKKTSGYLGKGAERIKIIKTTAPRIPAWSPTVVLTERHPG